MQFIALLLAFHILGCDAHNFKTVTNSKPSSIHTADKGLTNSKTTSDRRSGYLRLLLAQTRPDRRNALMSLLLALPHQAPKQNHKVASTPSHVDMHRASPLLAMQDNEQELATALWDSVHFYREVERKHGHAAMLAALGFFAATTAGAGVVLGEILPLAV
jgi:hypothetical protein